MDTIQPRKFSVPLEKAEGALLALAAGDALGWPQEFPRNVCGQLPGASAHVEFVQWTRRSGGRFRPFEELIHAGDYSDDTQLALAIARSRTKHGTAWWKAFTRTELPLWLLYERGGGGATKRAANAWAAGHPPWRSSNEAKIRQYFKAGGNGVAMRVLPHALFLSEQEQADALLHDVVLDGTATHGHPRALIGATVYAHAAWSLVRRSTTLGFGELLDMLIDDVLVWSKLPESHRNGGTWLDAAQFATASRYEAIWDRTAQEMRELLEKARQGLQEGALADDHAVLKGLGCFGHTKGAGTSSAAAVAYLVARHAAQPVQGILRPAFEKGADTDTLAAMVGGLLGCLAGHEWLPSPWLDVQDADFLREMARRLAQGPDRARGVPVEPARPAESILSDLAANLTNVPLGQEYMAHATALPDPKPIAKSVAVKAWKLRTSDGQTLFVTRVGQMKERSPTKPRSQQQSLPMSTNNDAAWQYPGARWWKFDLHTHTPGSADYGKGPQQATLKQLAPRDWLLGYMRAGVDCVAVTDHNSGAWIDPLKEALTALEQEGHEDFRPMTLFPGVEITAHGSVHILAVLDPSCQSADVDALLGAVRFEGTRGASDSSAKHSAIQVVEAICVAGGLPILAHVDGPAGAWKLRGNSLAPLLDVEGLFALEVVDPSHKKPQIYRDRKLNWAEVIGSDSHHPTKADGAHYPGARYTWIKMASPSLEGLRLALLDGGNFSLRRSDATESFDPFAAPANVIEAIEIEDARYMGRNGVAKFEFGPWLNALVGGRGTGKSTVLHALRLAARRQSELEEHSGPHHTFREFARVPKDRRDRGGLNETTSVRWLVRRDGILYRVLWRQDDKGVAVQHDEAGWKESPSQTVTSQRFPLRLFSQGQIAELARGNEALLRVVDDAAQIVRQQQRQLGEAQAAFSALRARIREVRQRLGREDDLVFRLQDVESKLKRFEDAGHRAVLTAYRRRERQRQESERQLGLAMEAAARLEVAAEELALEDLPDGVFALEDEDKEAVAILATLATAVRRTAGNIRNEAAQLREDVQEQREKLAGSAWQSAADNTTEDYRALTQTLLTAGVTDPNEYDKLIQDRALLEGERELLDSTREELDRLVKESNEWRDAVLKARRTMSDARSDFLSGTLADNRFVRIAIRRYGEEPRIIEGSLRQCLDITDDRFQDDILSEDGERGIVADLMTGLPEEEARRSVEIERRVASLKTSIKRACAGDGNFGGHFNNYFKREFNRKPELLDRMLTWFPEDALVVEYSPRGDGKEFRPIHQASAGQRSAAMLAFLLAYGEEPLVLDQPEDDLDNHLIYDLVVRQIRENKLRRQIIVVTHNPNIVVNGDAEVVHALRFANGQCVVGQSGSLQEAKIRDEVCQIMEGGREAFARRYRRLGKGPGDV